jgi:hypothetical protein
MILAENVAGIKYHDKHEDCSISERLHVAREPQ